MDNLHYNDKKNLLKNIEVTIDFDYASNEHRSNNYSQKNFEALISNSIYLNKISINSPIFGKVEQSHMRILVDKINNLSCHNISLALMRFMPVGKAFDSRFNETYNPSDVIEYFQKNLRADNKNPRGKPRGIGRLLAAIGID